MFDTTTPDPEYSKYFGERKDGKNLVNEWLKGKKVTPLNDEERSETDSFVGLRSAVFNRLHYENNNNRPNNNNINLLLAKIKYIYI